MPVLTNPMALELTASSAAAAESFGACEEGYLAFAPDLMERLKEVLTLDPGMPMARILRGYLLLLGRRREYVGAAARVAEALEEERAMLLPREAQHLDALDAWLKGDTEATLARWEEILHECPTDALALKLAHFSYLYAGRARELRDSINRVAYAWNSEQPWYAYFLGMQAFGLEETGEYARAQRLAEEALERNAVEPWAVHAVAHCLEMQDRWEEGRAAIERHRPNWSTCNLANHLAWHSALMCIDAGDERGALSTLDAALARDDADMPPHIVDSVALLQRLELCGVDPGGRWTQLADLSDERDRDHSLVFFDAHYMLAYAAAGREEKARDFLASLEAYSRAVDTANARVARTVGLPLLGGLMDYKLGRFGEAYTKLSPLRYEIVHIGGSHAQRDLFQQVIIDAAARSANSRDALMLLSERTQASPGNALSQVRLADALEECGLVDSAEQARVRAAGLLGS
jgi:tetratricopeptide (TPR) repeat protein